MSDVVLFQQRINKRWFFIISELYGLSKSPGNKPHYFPRCEFLLFDYYCRHTELTAKWQIRRIVLGFVCAEIDVWIQFISSLSMLPSLENVVIGPVSVMSEGGCITLDQYSLGRSKDNDIFIGNAVYSLVMHSARITNIDISGMGITSADLGLIMHGINTTYGSRLLSYFNVSIQLRKTIGTLPYMYTLRSNERIGCTDWYFSYRSIASEGLWSMTYGYTIPNDTALWSIDGCFIRDMSISRVDEINRGLIKSKRDLTKIQTIIFSHITNHMNNCNLHLPEFVYLAKNLKSLSIFHSPFLLSQDNKNQ